MAAVGHSVTASVRPALLCAHQVSTAPHLTLVHRWDGLAQKGRGQTCRPRGSHSWDAGWKSPPSAVCAAQSNRLSRNSSQ